ncbi:MAG: hypothetical protein H6658_06615 [Ardenticatenaceae bacterium]|nr:hypothetical protein [Ardenticatenaceae bacterium]
MSNQSSAITQRLWNYCTANLSRAERLCQARNGRAFTGQLVPQSPSGDLQNHPTTFGERDAT